MIDRTEPGVWTHLEVVGDCKTVLFTEFAISRRRHEITSNLSVDPWAATIRL